jgi:hypothetical protein
MCTQAFGCCLHFKCKNSHSIFLCVFDYNCFPIKARAGVEMALIDAVANSIRIPLWRLFGGASDTVTTDITVYGYLITLCTISRKFINAFTEVDIPYFPT